MVTPVQMAQDAQLERGAEAADQQGRRDQRGPETAGDMDGGIADIGAQHEERTMREVHDAHDAEDQRQADAEEEQQRRLGQRVEALGDEEAEEVHLAHRLLPLPLREGVGGRGRCGRWRGPLPPTPSRKGRGRIVRPFSILERHLPAGWRDVVAGQMWR